MTTIWVMLVQSGLLPATLIDAREPELLPPGAQPWWEVNLTLESFPRVVSPDGLKREAAVLEAQNANLIARAQLLEAELNALQTGATSRDAVFESGFDYRAYRDADEHRLYLQAWVQSDHNATRAAQLMTLDPHTWRSRAETLGIYRRRKQ